MTHKLLLDQSDLLIEKKLQSCNSHAIYKVRQPREEGFVFRWVKVVKELDNPYALKRAKDLLVYLNQFPKRFAHLSEVRKVGHNYLFIFDFVSSRTLTKSAKKTPFDDKQLNRFLKDMVRILGKVHKVGFVHGNIRPDNVLVGKKRVFLMNWDQAMPGLSSYDTEQMTAPFDYTPPERMNGRYEESGDIYSLGCVLYYALTGKHIYRLNKVNDTYDQLYAQAFHSPRKLNSLPIFWRQLILWMTQKQPEKRPTLNDLQLWLKDQVCPDWIRQASIDVVNNYPENTLSYLASYHYQYPTFNQAKQFIREGDMEMAFNLFENLAFQGNTAALIELGQFYEHGKLIKQSYLKAMNAYHQAFEKGSPHGAYELARLFASGLGMPVNLSQAYKLNYFAAKRGYAEGQLAVGKCYLEGKGVVKNRIKAEFWFSMAADQGILEAQKLLRQHFKKQPIGSKQIKKA